MKHVKQDEKKRIEEKLLKEEKLEKEKQRKEYMEKLIEDPRFKEYIIDGIINRNLADLTDIRKLGNLSGKEADLKELGNLVLQADIARRKLEAILSEIMN